MVMKRKIIIISAAVLVLFFAFLLVVRIQIRKSVIEHISEAVEFYEGTAEDALIAMLQDENAPMTKKTHTAVWTLGQIKSEKALPILKAMYKDDPKGETCYGKHDSLICQYEIYKAINAIEKIQLFKFPGLKNASLSQD